MDEWDNSPRAEIAKLLDDRERLLWSGRPVQGLLFRTADFFMVPFSLIWFGFSAFWFASVAQSGVSVFALFGLPFLGVGLYMLLGRFFLDRAVRAKTTYALTDRRVIVTSGVLSRTVQSKSLRTLADLTLDEKESGAGVITLGPKAPNQEMLAVMRWPGMTAPAPSLELAGDARKIFNQIRQAQVEDERRPIESRS